MRGPVIRRWPAAGAALALCLTLTACQGETMTAFDAADYVRGVLDETYKGAWDNAFLDLVDLTDGEAQDAYEASLNEEYKRFAYQFDLNDSLLTEETRQSALDLLAGNKAQFGCVNLELVSGAAPQVLEDLPAPDRVFLGGTSGEMEEILAVIFAKNPAARVVCTAVTLETMGEAARCFAPLSGAGMVQVAATRTRKAGPYHLMDAQNPVWIFSGEGKHE